MTTLRRAELDDVAVIAELHAKLIHEGFLARLGTAFLRRLYRRAVRSPNAFVMVADDDVEVGGFVAASEDTGAFYREFLLRDSVLAGLAALPRVAQSPRFVLETLRYGVRGAGDLPKAEILAVAVARDRRQGGLGTRLVASAVDELKRRGAESARVVTAVGNQPALRMYEHAGFRRHGVASVHRGVEQAVLVWP